MSEGPLSAILDAKGAIIVARLDDVVRALYEQGDEGADRVLRAFKDHPFAWRKVVVILQKSKRVETKWLALDILRDAIRLKWHVIGESERAGIKQFVVSRITQLSSTPAGLGNKLLRRFNLVLVEAMKKDWPKNWQGLVPGILRACKANLSVCENHMHILMILSEDIFDFAKERLSTKKKEELKQVLNKEFRGIFEVMMLVFTRASKVSLLAVTLKALNQYLGWIPVGWVFRTNLLASLVERLLSKQFFIPLRNEVFRCLDVVSRVDISLHHKDVMCNLFLKVSQVLLRHMPLDNNSFAEMFKRVGPRDKHFIRALAIFFKSFLTKHLPLAESRPQANVLAHRYMLSLSEVEDGVIFHICLDYWNYLVKELCFSEKKAKSSALMLGPPPGRKDMYRDLLKPLRGIIVSRMAKPEEILIVEDDNGELKRIKMKDVAATQMHHKMRMCLKHLTLLDPINTQDIMLRRLRDQVRAPTLRWSALNSLCWSIGAISGSMIASLESRFLVRVVTTLLDMCKRVTGRPNKAVVASNLMYVVQKYPRFLNCHWTFLRTVVQKLFDFMEEKFPGVQTMSCNTFLCIALATKQQFVIRHPKDTRPYIFDILGQIGRLVGFLEPGDIHIFFEGIGVIVDEAPRKSQEMLMQGLMEMPNAKWGAIMNRAKQRLQSLADMATMDPLRDLIMTNRAVAKSCRKCYLFQMKRIFPNLMNLYRFYSGEVSQAIVKGGPRAAMFAAVRKMRSVKSEILGLMETFVSRAHRNHDEVIFTQFVGQFLKVVLEDYSKNIPNARDPMALSLLSTMICRFKQHMIGDLPAMLSMAFKFTLPLITKDFVSFPEHRTALYRLIRSVTMNCFQTFFRIPADGFKVVIESILWAVKDRKAENYMEGLVIIRELLVQLHKLNIPQRTNVFFRNHYLRIFKEVLVALTDGFHQAGFELQTQILRQMIFVVVKDVVKVPIFDTQQFPRTPNNKVFLRDFLANVLAKAFMNILKKEIGGFVMRVMSTCVDADANRRVFHDFLVLIKEFTNKYNFQKFFQARLAITQGGPGGGAGKKPLAIGWKKQQ